MIETNITGLALTPVDQDSAEALAGITATNTASIRLVKRLGFELFREQPTHQSYQLLANR